MLARLGRVAGWDGYLSTRGGECKFLAHMPGIVKIANLDRFITAEIIKKYFRHFGDIKKVAMPKKSAPYAQVEFATTAQAKRAIAELDNTTLHTLRGKTQRVKQCNPHFVWELSLLSPDYLWEEDPHDTTEVEKRIVNQKKKNMNYVESLAKEIKLSPRAPQRPIIRTISSDLLPSAPKPE